MVIGIGTDIQRISELAKYIEKPEDPFVTGIFTETERRIIFNKENKAGALTARFAGKEAVFKALQTDGNAVRLNEIELLDDENGAPYVKLYGKAYEVLMQKKAYTVLVSLSHSGDYAMAFAVINQSRDA